MSASLVGSEMCIRDSSGSSMSQRRQQSQHQHIRQRTERQRQMEQQCITCLLYTSDAADDM
eukprot:7560178-Alexandrium_andersonii.AAC.1